MRIYGSGENIYKWLKRRKKGGGGGAKKNSENSYNSH
jgi:hypothetical protein